jgi:hypothetical protein
MGENPYSGLGMLLLRYGHCYRKEQRSPQSRKNMEDTIMNHLVPHTADHRSHRQPVPFSALEGRLPSFVLFGSPMPAFRAVWGFALRKKSKICFMKGVRNG